MNIQVRAILLTAKSVLDQETEIIFFFLSSPKDVFGYVSSAVRYRLEQNCFNIFVSEGWKKRDVSPL